MEAKNAMEQFMQQIKENATDCFQIAKIVVRILENPALNNFSEFLELDEIKQVK